MANKALLHKQKGVVIILVLWIIVMATMFVSYLTSETRFLAAATQSLMSEVKYTGNLQSVLARAKYEIVQSSGLRNNPFILATQQYNEIQFAGEILKMTYPDDNNLEVRVLDHAGKINLNTLTQEKMRQLLEKHLQKDDPRIKELVDAWEDWRDVDNLKRLNGAEDKYYKGLKPSYKPANNALQDSDELLLIKGFKDLVFIKNNLGSFTTFGQLRGVNPNYASKETLLLIPGVNSEGAEQIIQHRQAQQFKRLSELNDYIDVKHHKDIAKWFGLVNGRTFSIIVYDKTLLEEAPEKEQSIYAYKEIITTERQGKNPPLTLRIYPSIKVSIPKAIPRPITDDR